VTALWWVWSILGLVFCVTALGLFVQGLWQIRAAVLRDVAWSGEPHQSRGDRLVDAGRTLIIAGLAAATAWLCLAAAGRG
jgi:hypothetical protein